MLGLFFAYNDEDLTTHVYHLAISHPELTLRLIGNYKVNAFMGRNDG